MTTMNTLTDILEQEYEQHLATHAPKKNAKTSNTITRAVSIFIPQDTPLAKDVLEPYGHAWTSLYNQANYRVRNIFTGLHKPQNERTQNENDSITWANAATRRYKQKRSETLQSKITKLENEDDTDENRKALASAHKEQRELSKLKTLADEKRSYCNYNYMNCIFLHHAPECYTSIPSAIAQEVLRHVHAAWKGFFESSKEYKKTPDKYTGRPKLPGYKTRGSISTITFSQRGYSLKHHENGQAFITFAGYHDKEHTLEIGRYLKERKQHAENLKVRTIEAVPVVGGWDVIITYTVSRPELLPFNGRVAGCDFGSVNLMTIVGNAVNIQPLIVEGKLARATNRYYNMKTAKISRGYNGCYTSHEKSLAWRKRATQLDNMMGQAANRVLAWLVENDITALVVGKNVGWKSRPPKWFDAPAWQSFVFLPFEKLIRRLRDKCESAGIRFIVTEESYTSKASLVDGDFLPEYGVEPASGYPVGSFSRVSDRHVVFPFSGSRVHRGLYRAVRSLPGRECGILLNADVNGAGNIVRKVFPSAFSRMSDWRFLMNPRVVSLTGAGCELPV